MHTTWPTSSARLMNRFRPFPPRHAPCSTAMHATAITSAAGATPAPHNGATAPRCPRRSGLESKRWEAHSRRCRRRSTENPPALVHKRCRHFCRPDAASTLTPVIALRVAEFTKAFELFHPADARRDNYPLSSVERSSFGR